MNKVQTQWNLGNFTIDLTSDVSDAMRDRLASLGLRFLGQRNTEVDKILGGFETVGGKSKRKANWKRNDVPFDPALASKLVVSFGELELPTIEGEEKSPIVNADALVTEYTREATAMKYRDAKEVVSRHESANDLESWLAAKCKYDGETHGADGEYAPAMLQAVHAVIQVVIAEQKAVI